MRIKSIEPTPSPNTMKINLDQELSMGKSNNYKKGQAEGAPSIIQDILQIEGVKGVYHVADFLAVERNAKFDWKELLQKIRQAFGESIADLNEGPKINEHFGEIKVLVQLYKGIPMQVKLTNGQEEKRFGLPEQFVEAVKQVQLPGDNVVMERRWKDYGNRYGESGLEQVGDIIVEELLAAYPNERLNMIVEQVKNPESKKMKQPRNRLKVSLSDFGESDWRIRYQLLEQMDDPSIADLPVLEKALQDEKASIRRLAVVYLGMIEDKRVLALLYKALEDKSVTVRRTAGDTLSDLGYVEAMNAMMKALQDKSKLVRWRAAMFLYEVGNEQALVALKEAENDPEFEVSLQIKLAIERIEQGEEAKGSVWKQMTDVRTKQ
ncbi:conserved virulence factor C family protein [Bacillus sp. V3B]|uniref:conserved virulence factor C family protein n=1 Tax=Bacillus sp. V3B TaxID=2804915 RepID=UPI00210B814C|nr:conserved virulence factor C family protein [Bacillus sp. V3B]MCQ6273974.1 conserved virulence factor C family protein [Bacillus sp. V3B]